MASSSSSITFDQVKNIFEASSDPAYAETHLHEWRTSGWARRYMQYVVQYLQWYFPDTERAFLEKYADIAHDWVDTGVLEVLWDYGSREIIRTFMDGLWGGRLWSDEGLSRMQPRRVPYPELLYTYPIARRVHDVLALGDTPYTRLLLLNIPGGSDDDAGMPLIQYAVGLSQVTLEMMQLLLDSPYQLGLVHHLWAYDGPYAHAEFRARLKNEMLLRVNPRIASTQIIIDIVESIAHLPLLLYGGTFLNFMNEPVHNVQSWQNQFPDWLERYMRAKCLDTTTIPPAWVIKTLFQPPICTIALMRILWRIVDDAPSPPLLFDFMDALPASTLAIALKSAGGIRSLTSPVLRAYTHRRYGEVEERLRRPERTRWL